MIQKFHFWLVIQKNWEQNLEEIFVPQIHSSTILNSHKVEATQMSIGK